MDDCGLNWIGLFAGVSPRAEESKRISRWFLGDCFDEVMMDWDGEC
jgi:hypothetical protein